MPRQRMSASTDDNFRVQKMQSLGHQKTWEYTFAAELVFHRYVEALVGIRDKEAVAE